MATNGTSHEEYSTPQSSDAGQNSSSQNLPKDEVGWYFVEQYYTTLSKAPEKLHLYYSKKSQFVIGQETEPTRVSIGRAAIQEHIKKLDFEDCKIAIYNVDSQASGDNIVIQVIGHSSNRSGEPKKFVQTFVLAQQPSGYFVLNDILRYIKEDYEEEETAPAAEEPASVEPEVAPEPAAQPEVAPEEPVKEAQPVVDPVVEQKPEEETASETEADVPAVETPASEPVVEAEEPVKAESIPEPEAVAQEVAEEEVKKPEEPKEPAPTPAAVRPAAPAPAEPEKPREPPKPMTWASRLAANSGAARPAVPVALPKTGTPPAAASARAPAPAAPAAPTAAPTASNPSPAAAKDEWQTAETRRQNRPQSTSVGPPEKEGTMAYIKYVTEKVQDDDLKNTLTAFGELAYFDINRQKNCAFVEFKTPAGYNAAVAANPHTVNGENIVVEQRRPKSTAYGGSNYNTTRGGGPAGRGRGGFESGRTGSPGTGRGGFTGAPRGRGGAPRGRGGAAQASAA